MPSVSGSQPIYVGFWKRFLVFMIDSLVMSFVIFPSLYLLYGGSFEFLQPYHQSEYVLLEFVISWGVPCVLFVWFWIKYAATPGKMLISAVIVDAITHQKPTIFQWVVRYFSYIISLLPCFLGFLWIAVDRRKQGWHDKLARTVVIQKIN
jgi:uncharacterized RDD family membrane protein YckC